jgi:hypothetical protein
MENDICPWEAEVDTGKIQCCGSGIRLPINPWIRDPRWVENQDPDPG